MNIFKTIWENKVLRELILVVVSAAAVQLAFGLNELLGMIDTAKSWGDLIDSTKAWVGAFSFALVVTVIKQSIAWGIAALGGATL